MLRTYRTCNPMVGFSNFELYNKLLGGVILLRVTPSVTWTRFVYSPLDANFDKFIVTKFHGDKKSIIMLSINCLNSSFCNLK